MPCHPSDLHIGFIQLHPSPKIRKSHIGIPSKQTVYQSYQCQSQISQASLQPRKSAASVSLALSILIGTPRIFITVSPFTACFPHSRSSPTLRISFHLNISPPFSTVRKRKESGPTSGILNYLSCPFLFLLLFQTVLCSASFHTNTFLFPYSLISDKLQHSEAPFTDYSLHPL